MTSFVESAYSLGYLFSQPNKSSILPTEFSGKVREWQKRANELNIDVVFKEDLVTAVSKYPEYFRIDRKCVVRRVDGKVESDYEWYFNAYIPENILNIMSDKV